MFVVWVFRNALTCTYTCKIIGDWMKEGVGEDKNKKDEYRMMDR